MATLEPSQRLTVTVILLLSTINVGGSSLHSTSMSERYCIVASSSRLVPSDGIGRVLNRIAVSCEFCLISSFRIRCWARLGRSLKDKAKPCVAYDEPPSSSLRAAWSVLYEWRSSGMLSAKSPWLSVEYCELLREWWRECGAEGGW